MLIPVTKKKVSDQIIEQLKEKIKNQEFPLDSKLPSENELARMFGVSRAPIREAISVLVASGLVKSVQGGGNFVQEVPLVGLLDSVTFEMATEEEVFNLLELRTVIETEAAGFAARRRTDEELELIRISLEQFAQTIDDEQAIGDVSDYNFHQSIVRASHNSFLIQTLENVADLYQKTMNYSLKQNLGLKRKRESVYHEHLAIFEAIKNRNEEVAANSMKKHLINARKKLGDPRLESSSNQ